MMELVKPEELSPEYLAQAARLQAALARGQKEYWQEIARIQREEQDAALADLPEYMTLEQATAYVTRHTDSWNRADEVLYLFPRMHESDWFVLLGQWWENCDRIGGHRADMKHMFTLYRRTPHIIPEMMRSHELRALNALPKMVTIYRGCTEGDKGGLSWTLDKAVAVKFPTLSRYRTSSPVLLTAQIRKSRIVALKLGRREREVITFNVKNLTVEQLY